jgi:hypothetical protein
VEDGQCSSLHGCPGLLEINCQRIARQPVYIITSLRDKHQHALMANGGRRLPVGSAATAAEAVAAAAAAACQLARLARDWGLKGPL